MISRDMIDLAILGLLQEQELHGYELKKRLGELLGPRSSVSFGSLYPALARLERSGAVKAVEHHTAMPATPSSGSLKGEMAAFRARVRGAAVRGARNKKVYGITERGEVQLRALLADADVSDDRAFALRVAFCRHLDPSERLALFERRRAELGRRLDERRRGHTGGTRLDSYLRSLWDHDTDQITHDLAWLDRLIEAERSDINEERSS
jgi:DNA-binding PadR family transcriptional regulator